MMLVLHFLREGDLFLDVGANVGSYCILASGVCHARTWAFEPDPNTAQALKRNISINGLNELVEVYELAISDCEGQVPFTVERDTTNRIASATDENVRIVAQNTLDAITEGHAPIMVKMDVEGHEEAALRGAKDLLARQSLQLIELETVTPMMATILHENEFEPVRYDPFQRRLRKGNSEAQSANQAYARDLDFVAERLASAASVHVLGHTI